jgi:hypothetical protein
VDVGEQKRGMAVGTINRSISALRRMFTLEKKQGKIRDIPYFPRLKEAAPRQGFFEREQYERLFACVPDHLRLPLAMGYCTGMLQGEFSRLRGTRSISPQTSFVCGPGRLRTTRPRGAHNAATRRVAAGAIREAGCKLPKRLFSF